MSSIIISLLVLVAGFVAPIIRRTFTQSNKADMPIRILCIVIAVLLFASGFVVYVAPGEISKVYAISGESYELQTGYNFTPPWNQISTWKTTLRQFVFLEKGDPNDPNDAFGGQTKNGDYLTTVANISVRIDPKRLDAYVAMFGQKNIDDDLGVLIKGVLKDSFEQCLETYTTEDVMPNKSRIVAMAREIAIGRLEEQFPIIVGDLTYPDIVASQAYEEAIMLKAKLRMEKEQFELEAARNQTLAEANRIEAEGKAEVIRINAGAQAKAAEETAIGEAKASQAKAVAAAEVLRINTEAQAKAATEKAKGEAAALELMAAAEANALLAKTTAEAEGYQQMGVAYQNYPNLIQLKTLDNENAFINRWNGVYMPSIGGGGNTIGFANYTSLFEKLFALGFGGGNAEPEEQAVVAPILDDKP